VHQVGLLSTSLRKMHGLQNKKLGRLRLKRDDTQAETRFRLLAKRTSPFKSSGASVQSTTCSRGVHISGSNAAYTMFRGGVKSTVNPLHSPVSPSLPLPCVTVCRHVSTGLYIFGVVFTEFVQTIGFNSPALYYNIILRYHIIGEFLYGSDFKKSKACTTTLNVQ
jgi:hypothetical protein